MSVRESRWLLQPLLVLMVILCGSTCSAQERTWSFIHQRDSLKEWSCPLPVEATVHDRNKKKKTTYVIIAADDSGFVALSPVTDTTVLNSSEWKRAFAEQWHRRNMIEGDPTLSPGEKCNLIAEGWIGVLYQDTLRIPATEVKKIIFHYSDASKLQRTIPVAAYIAAGCVFMAGMVELLVASDPEVKSTMEAPYPAILLFAGLGAVAASGSWMFHTYHKVIRTDDWHLQRGARAIR